MGVRLWAGRRGSDVTTSGSKRLFSAWSIADLSSRGARDGSIGVENTRGASPSHTGHATEPGAVPSGRAISNTPSASHR